MPEGLPPTCSSIQVRSISSCLGVWATAPSTPKPPALVTAATTSRQWLKARIGYSTPNMSATAVFICIDPLLCGASERDRHAARAAHLSAGPGDGVGIGELERRDPFEEDLEGDLDLHAGEVGAEAPVDAGAEREVAVLGPVDDEPVGARSEEHTSALQSLMRISYAVFCLKKKIRT